MQIFYYEHIQLNYSTVSSGLNNDSITITFEYHFVHLFIYWFFILSLNEWQPRKSLDLYCQMTSLNNINNISWRNINFLQKFSKILKKNINTIFYDDISHQFFRKKCDQLDFDGQLRLNFLIYFNELKIIKIYDYKLDYLILIYLNYWNISLILILNYNIIYKLNYGNINYLSSNILC